MKILTEIVDGLVVDLFAGGGGASVALAAALGRQPDLAINHDPIALAVHRANHPQTRHLTADIWEVKPLDATGGKRVAVLWASPDCTHFSIAKGNVPRDQGIRSLAWVVVDWARETRPAVIFLENVREFQTWGPLGADGRPDRARMGETFHEWRRALEALGYVVDHRVLDASMYGAPTRRRRLFLVARCDSKPIAWPAPTHGPGLRPFHTAAECIDWSLPCPSIFGRKKPLAENTLFRIAEGIRRYVIDSPAPFVVMSNHGKREFRGQPLSEPLSTVTSARRGHALIVPALVQTGYGERKGQRPRALDIHAPLGTLVNGQKHGLVAAFLARHFGDPRRRDGRGGVVVGIDVREPTPTITRRDHHSLVTAHLATFRGTSASHPGCAPVDAPLPTITAGGKKGGVHVAEVRSFLTRYADARGQLRLGHDRYLVFVGGLAYEIGDIGFRMLQPEPELLRAQFGAFAEGYSLAEAKTKAAKTRLIGNSVAPEPAQALIEANVGSAEVRAA